VIRGKIQRALLFSILIFTEHGSLRIQIFKCKRYITTHGCTAHSETKHNQQLPTQPIQKINLQIFKWILKAYLYSVGLPSRPSANSATRKKQLPSLAVKCLIKNLWFDSFCVRVSTTTGLTGLYRRMALYRLVGHRFKSIPMNLPRFTSPGLHGGHPFKYKPRSTCLNFTCMLSALVLIGVRRT